MVADLFRDGPIIIQAKKAKGKNRLQVGVEAPQGLRVMRGDLIKSNPVI